MANGISTTYDITTTDSNGTKFILRVSLKETYTLESNTTDTLSVGLSVTSPTSYNRLYYIDGYVNIDGERLISMGSDAGASAPTHYVKNPTTNSYFAVTHYNTGYSDSPWDKEDIVHNSDGTKSVRIKIYLKFYDGYSSHNWSIDDERDINLTTIPRASTISATDANIGSVSTITVSKRATSFSHSIQYSFSESSSTTLTGYITSSGETSSTEVKFSNSTISFNIPSAFYEKIWDNPSGVCTLTCKTYTNSGNTYVDENSCTFTVYASKTICSPIINSRSVIDTNDKSTAITGDCQTLIANVSTATCSLSASAQNYAKIVSVNIGGATIDVTDDTTVSASRSISNITNRSISFSVLDSRGYPTASTITKNDSYWVDYIPLEAVVTVQRDTPTGSTATLCFNGPCYGESFKGANNASNILTISYKVMDGSTVISSGSITPDIKGKIKYEATIALENVEYTKTYSISYTVSDLITTISDTIDLIRGVPVFDWDQDDFAFHVDVEMDNNLDIGGDLNITGGLTAGDTDVSGSATVSGNLAVSGALSVGGKSLVNIIYPVGSIYMSANSTSPATLFGGTWVQLKDRFLLGAGDSYSAGSTGGSSSVTLTLNQIPNHRHEANSIGFTTSSSTSDSANEVMRSATKSNSYGKTTYTAYTGGGEAHNNMPPYLAVYIWKRTA